MRLLRESCVILFSLTKDTSNKIYSYLYLVQFWVWIGTVLHKIFLSITAIVLAFFRAKIFFQLWVQMCSLPSTSEVVSTGNFFPKNHTFPALKKYDWAPDQHSRVYGSNHTWTLKKNLNFLANSIFCSQFCWPLLATDLVSLLSPQKINNIFKLDVSFELPSFVAPLSWQVDRIVGQTNTLSKPPFHVYHRNAIY